MVASCRGNCNHPATLQVTKGIRIKGQTTIDNAGKQSPTPHDNTTIIDNITTPNSTVISVVIGPTQQFELTGLTIQATPAPGGSNSSSNNRFIQINSTGTGANNPVKNVRVWNNHLYGISGRCLWVSGGWVYGVADHNLFGIIGTGQVLLIEHQLLRGIHARLRRVHGPAVLRDR